MNRTCIVVADAGLARFYDVEEVESPRQKLKLVERTVLNNEVDLKSRGESVTGKVRTETNTNRGSGPVHRDRQRDRIARTRAAFRRRITPRRGHYQKWTRGVVGRWRAAKVGMMREPLRKALHPGPDLRTRPDEANLTAPELYDTRHNGIVPAHGH